MRQAYLIVKRGIPDLDIILKEAVTPVLKSCKLKPFLVDKYYQTPFTESRKVGHILEAEIVIADITYSDQNSYFEIGYVIGAEKHDNLILIARKDFDSTSPAYNSQVAKIYSNLAGLKILYWDQHDMESFKIQLEKEIINRLEILTSTEKKSASQWDEDWFSRNQATALFGLKRLGKSGFMEIRMSTSDFNLDIPHRELLEAAYNSQIKTFGWPIGCVLNDQKQNRPRARANGIYAEIENDDRKSFDYWTLRKDGTFYSLISLYEDTRKFGYLSLNIRTARITETLLYAQKLYSAFKVPRDAPIRIGIRHGGLKDRILTAIDKRYLHRNYTSSEDSIYNEIETNLNAMDDNLVILVEKFIQPLMFIFDFFHVDRKALSHIVDNFKNGKLVLS
ncbi:MAG: hypothetical protein APR63_06280 [Desulfuromonas sp. SDB]|nr:MAG: hypothetical protein APR63_06280 [Desulfuromonas sp. SDB]